MTTITVSINNWTSRSICPNFYKTHWTGAITKPKAKDDTEAQNMADAVYAIAKELKADRPRPALNE